MPLLLLPVIAASTFGVWMVGDTTDKLLRLTVVAGVIYIIIKSKKMRLR